MTHSLISAKSKCFQILHPNLTLSLHHLRYFVFDSIPKNMNIFVRICYEVRISHMQVIEIICLEYRLDLPIHKFLSFSIKLPINLNDSRMTLILTQQYHM